MFYMHKSIQRQSCAMGYGFWATEPIPANTVVLAEKPLMLKGARESTSDTMFALIKLAWDTRRAEFLRLAPRDNDVSVEYSIIREAHQRHVPHLSRKEARLFATKYVRNAFATADGPALLFQGAVFNHSCEPNVMFSLQAGVMVFRTCRDVREGEQLFDQYGSANKKNRDKRAYHARLREQYGFQCACLTRK